MIVGELQASVGNLEKRTDDLDIKLKQTLASIVTDLKGKNELMKKIKEALKHVKHSYHDNSSRSVSPEQ
jgi:hypothetical protein